MAGNFSFNRRLERLEQRHAPATAYRIHWRNEVDDGTASIVRDADGNWFDRDTGERLDVLELHWPQTLKFIE